MTEGPHTHHDYDDELAELRDVLGEMAGLVERQLADGLCALVSADAELGDQVCRGDHRINELELRVDQQATAIIARRQPAGPDLRFLLSAIRTGTDLERIGDEAGKLGRFAIELAGGRALEPGLLGAMERLGGDVREFLSAALEAHASGDTEAARALAPRVARVAEAQDGLTRELVTYMMEDPRTMQRVLHALWCARALERIGDHAGNICEAVVYAAEGTDLRHRGPREARTDAGTETGAETGGGEP